MLKRIAFIAVVLALPIGLGITIAASTDALNRPSDLTVHEWGTFTTVAGLDGKTTEWLPLGGPNDLPCFVNVYKNISRKVLVLSEDLNQPALDYNAARSRLLGSVRMETPVLYFYASEPRTADVRIAFPQGFVTEWYPQATVDQAAVRVASLKKPKTGATIVWKNVEVLPRASNPSFIQGSASSHYYTARATDANPIRVGGSNEKFLFYRGVGGFPVPINVTVTDEGKILIKHLQGKPSVILFENHGGKLGYRIVDTSKGEALLDPPALTESFESLRKNLQAVLVAQGLYEKEAAAMIETWRDSWFEEGTRVFYIVPPKMVDQILPLTVTPRPTSTARVFVGRVEVITPATVEIVENAILTNDTKTINAYGRFLGPIADRISPTKKVFNLLNGALARYMSAPTSCTQ
jgi:hypothetical protein